MKTLKIYYTSDVHGYLFPTDYLDKDEKPMGLLNVINNFKKDENTLILDGGDIFQGSPYINYFQKRKDLNNGIATVMNAGAYDYLTLGNHDFNYGLDMLKGNLNQLNAQVTAVNLLDEETGKELFPAKIHELGNGLKVGIIGFVTDYVNIWEKAENLKGLKIVSPLEAARKAVTELHNQVDILIGIYHGGFEADLKTGVKESTTTENVGYQIAQELPFDLLLTGHQHRKIEGQYLHDTYVVQPPNMAQFYFEILMELEEDGTKQISSRFCPAGHQHDGQLAAELENLEQTVQEYLDRPVGQIATPMKAQSHLALACQGDLFVELVGAVEKLATGADIAIVSMSNNSQQLPKVITVRDILTNYPFENSLFKLKITGKMLRQSIEHTADYFSLKDGEIIINPSWLFPKMEHYNYDFYLGISYTINVSNPVGRRVTRLTYLGEEVQDDQEFSVALNNYRAAGGGEYLDYQLAEVLDDTKLDIQQLIVDFVQTHEWGELTKILDFEVVK